MPKNPDEKTEVKTEMPASPAPVVKAPPPQLVTFDRWFVTFGKPDRWKAGMRAFADTTGKKTVAQWNAIFAGY